MKSFLPLLLGMAVLAGCSQKQDTTTGSASSSTTPAPAAAATASGSQATGDAFLTANGKEPGVITTASGLQYKVIKSGTGESPKATDRVKVNYEGKLTDGTIFDSSIQRGEPATFPVNAVIPGWVEALQLMKVGDKWQLFIPASNSLTANEARRRRSRRTAFRLIFEVELIDIEK